VFLKQITPDDLREFRTTWKMSPRTASKHIERMKTFFKFAMGFEWIKKNPALPTAAPKLEPSESIPFTEEQLEIFFKACDSYDGDGQRNSPGGSRMKNKQAKDFLVQEATEHASRENIPLSDMFLGASLLFRQNSGPLDCDPSKQGGDQHLLYLPSA
jgi:hypothetical protein